jgi:hypothetical protein
MHSYGSAKFTPQDETPGIGHNEAPDDFAPAARANALAKTANEWLASVKEITDQETAEACDSFLAQVRAEIQANDAERKRANAPHDQAIKANNNRFRPVTTMLETCERLLSPLKAGWLRREKDRLAAEKRAAEEAAAKAQADAEAARRKLETEPLSVQTTMVAQQAVDRAAAALEILATVEKTKPVVKGGLAARASGLRTYWSAEITDWPAATRHYQDRSEVRAIVQQLANADARTMKAALNVPGTQVKSEERA